MTSARQLQSAGEADHLGPLRRTIDEVLTRMRVTQKDLDSYCAKLFGGDPDEAPDRIIWRGIIGFANSADIGSIDFNKLIVLLSLCSGTETSHRGFDFLDKFEDVQSKAGVGGDKKAAFEYLSREYHPALKILLQWLCSPGKHKNSGTAAISFLWAKGSGVETRPICNRVKFEDYPIFYWKVSRFRTVMTPICKFILDRIERYHDGELDLDDAIPIRICNREGCEKFFLQRSGRKKFCSSECCDHAQPRRAGIRNRDYMRLYRLEELPLPALRLQLKSREKRQWLSDIEKWPDLAYRVKDLRKRVSTR